MTHPFFSELNETLICEHKTNSWNTDDTTPYHCHDGYEILVFIGGHASSAPSVTEYVPKNIILL